MCLLLDWIKCDDLNLGGQNFYFFYFPIMVTGPVCRDRLPGSCAQDLNALASCARSRAGLASSCYDPPIASRHGKFHVLTFSVAVEDSLS